MNATSAPQHRVLIVEDDPTHATLLAGTLADEGFGTDILPDGLAVAERVRATNPDAVLLDLTLPGKDGFAICREIRAFSTVPLIIVTGRDDEVDRLRGLQLGADDYVCKPYHAREVVARVRAVLRRAIDWGNAGFTSQLSFDDERHEAHWKGKRLDLTAVEFRLLRVLGEQPGRVFSRASLLDAIYVDFRVINDRTVDSHVKNLRRKIASIDPEADPIESVYGVGYRFAVEP